MKPKVRSEQEIFSELQKLCVSSGYAHIIALFCFRDNMITYVDEMSVKDVLNSYSTEKLVRTEISTLIGLMCKKKLNIKSPPPATTQEYMDKTEALLKELHYSMMLPVTKSFDPTKIQDKDFNPFKSGSILREAIFYGGEAAYNFQYREFANIRYQKDSDWINENKGFSINEAYNVIQSISHIQNEKMNNVIEEQRNWHPDKWTMLPAFIFTAQEVASGGEIDKSIAKAVIESFVLPVEIKTDHFLSLDDFNPRNAYPIIKINDHDYLLFQSYSLLESLYETPFFWFLDDSSYAPTAGKHRGEFTEIFSNERLKKVFGDDRVFTNVEIYKNKKTRVGEIDVLVLFANRAIVLQAKSKKLTILARKGNDNSLRKDFKKAVQDAYDQAFLCAEFLLSDKYKLIDVNGDEICVNREFKEIYPFCIVSDHYPSLSHQAREFLRYKTTETIMPPFVMDVFLLDVMTEMLQSPLYFLSYINKRSLYIEKVISNHELTILSYHLKNNLWLEKDLSMIHLSDDICADLDLAMQTRRDNAPGIDTPEGILTKFNGTVFSQIIKNIEERDDPGTIDLGFMLLSLSGDTIDQINDGIPKMVEASRKNGSHHDFTLVFDEERYGLTIHSNYENPFSAKQQLTDHCNRRKYTSKAKTWFGLFLDPRSGRVQFGINLEFDWVRSEKLEKQSKTLKKPLKWTPKSKANFTTKIRKKRKIGRNEKCPCGSGKKYKKCCL